MENEDLAQTLGTVENEMLEFKESSKNASTRDEIGRTICAMANDLTGVGGGDILVGVDDQGKPLDEVDVSDGVLLALAAFRDDGRILDVSKSALMNVLHVGQPTADRIHATLADDGGEEPDAYERR